MLAERVFYCLYLNHHISEIPDCVINASVGKLTMPVCRFRLDAQAAVIPQAVQNTHKGGPIGLIHACGRVVIYLAFDFYSALLVHMYKSLAPVSCLLQIIAACIDAMGGIILDIQVF